MPERPQSQEKDLLLHHLPPQSLEAEESLLSAILIDSETVLDVLEILHPEDFYRSAHQKIFAAVATLFNRQEPIDLVTLTNYLRDQKQLEGIGGAAYLAQLVDTVPLAINTQHYAKIVHQKALLRNLIAKTQEIARRCFENPGEVDDLIDYAERSIFEVSGSKLSPSFFPLSKIIETNIDALEERQGNKALVTGVPTGFSRLDELTAGFQEADLIILAGRPGMGKTALALNIARNAAVNAGVPTAIFSLEMSKEQLTFRMLSSEARVDASRMRKGFITKDDWIGITDAAGVLSEAPIFVDESPDLSVMEVRAKARRLKMEKDLGMVIIDYLQLMKSRAAAERRDLEISEISRSLKALAKELELPVLALSQLNRKLEERHDKRPQLADLRESGALEQDADVVAFIYRDELYNKAEDNPNKGTAELILAKQRNGPTGIARLAFLNAYTRFEDLADEHFIKP